MGASHVAGTVRGRALARRRIGAAATRAMAGLPTLRAAVEQLADGPYGRYVRPGQTLAEAETATLRTLLWHLRVLAGWQSREPSRRIRLLATAFELANLDEHVRRLGGSAAAEPFDLGRLGVAWSRLARTSSLPEVRQVLAQSVWGDPGAETAFALTMVPRLRWLRRVAVRIPEAGDWACGAAVLVLAREHLLRGRRLGDREIAELRPLTGPAPLDATDVDALRRAAGPRGGWVLDGVTAPNDLWRGEARWWGRLDRDGAELLWKGRFTGTAAVGCAAVLAADAWRVRLALASAAHGGGSMEVLNAMA